MQFTETYADLTVLRHVLASPPCEYTDMAAAIQRGQKRRRTVHPSATVKYARKSYAVAGQSYTLGRYYTTPHHCYQTMLREFRPYLADGMYIELDIENCHPRLLAHFAGDSVKPVIHEYINHRADKLSEVMGITECSRDVAKELFLRVMYGGTIEAWMADHHVPSPPRFCYEFSRSVRAIADSLTGDPLFDDCTIVAKFKKRFLVELNGGRKWKATAMALFLQHQESAIMEVVINKLGEAGINPGALIHDAVLLPTKCDVDPELLAHHVKVALGFDISLKYKPLTKDTAWYSQLTSVSSFNDNGTGEDDCSDLERLVLKVDGDTHIEMAYVFKALFPDKYAFLGKQGWFIFEQPRWRMIDSPECLLKDMVNELSSVVGGVLERIVSGDIRPNNEGAGMRLSEALKKLKTIGYLEQLARAVRIVYMVTDPDRWLDRMDSDPFLLGMDDCVYDLKTHEFRDGRPEDMVSLTTKLTREQVEAVDLGVRDRIISALKSLYRDEEVYEYLMNELAVSITGHRPDDGFNIMTGSGANGKSVIATLTARSHGGYHYRPDISVFVKRSVGGSVLSSETAKLRAMRLVIPGESERDDELRAGRIKSISGHDPIQAREIYRTAREFRCMCTLMIPCNRIPPIDEEGGSIKRRLRILRHDFQFKDNPMHDNEKLIDRTLIRDCDTELYGAQFLGMLMDWYKRVGHDYSPPRAVLEEAADYLAENDEFASFLDEYCEVDPQHHVVLLDLYDAFSKTSFAHLARSNKALSSILKLRGFQKSLEPGTKRCRFHGLRLIEQACPFR